MSTAALPRPTVPLMLSNADDVAALAVDEHQGLVGAEAAQRGRTQRVGPVGDGRLRKVERRDQLVEDFVGLGLTGVGDRFGTDDVDWNRASATVRSVRRVPVTMMCLGSGAPVSA